MTTTQRLSANTILASKGQTVTLTTRTSGTYDPATGSNTVTETTKTASAVILPFGAGLRNMENSLISTDDRLCYLSGLDSDGAALAAPKVDTKLTDANGVEYTVREVAPLEPAGLAIIHELTVRLVQ